MAPEAAGELLRTWSGWGFLICGVVALGYGLGALYGSGSRVVLLDVSAGTGRDPFVPIAGAPAAPSPAVPSSGAAPGADSPGAAASGGSAPGSSGGSIRLDPRMNPLRAVLRASHAPVGSTRIRYEIALLDDAGTALWERTGALGSHGDEASIVHTTTSLGDFDVAKPGVCSVRVRMSGGSMDDLRAASLELRRNVLRVDRRVTWSFGLAALACLIVNLVASRNRRWPYRLESDESRTAA